MRKQRKAVRKSISKSGIADLDIGRAELGYCIIRVLQALILSSPGKLYLFSWTTALVLLATAAQGVFRRTSARKLKAKSPADRCLPLTKMSNCCASEQFLCPLLLLKTGQDKVIADHKRSFHQHSISRKQRQLLILAHLRELLGQLHLPVRDPAGIEEAL